MSADAMREGVRRSSPGSMQFHGDMSGKKLGFTSERATGAGSSSATTQSLSKEQVSVSDEPAVRRRAAASDISRCLPSQRRLSVDRAGRERRGQRELGANKR